MLYVEAVGHQELRKIFEQKMEGVGKDGAGDYKEAHDEDNSDLQCTPNFIRMFKYSRLGYVGRGSGGSGERRKYV